MIVEHTETALSRTIKSTALIPTLLVVGASEGTLPDLRRVASESSLGLVHKTNVQSAAAWLESTRPAAVLVDLRAVVALDLFSTLRRAPRWADVPMIGLTQTLTEIAFAETFWAGGDDLVRPCDSTQLVARLRATKRGAGTGTPPARGSAVVGGAEPAFRVAAGRVLQGAGYDVEFALTAEEVEAGARKPGTQIVVTSEALPQGSSMTLLESLRASGCDVPFVISVPVRHIARAQVQVRKLSHVELCDSFSAPDELLFLANSLVAAPMRSRRVAPRLPFGTMVRVRPAGGEDDIVGFSHNVSQKGLFVRSLYPFAPGDAVWLEIVPPRGERRVRLSAQVMWHRPFGPLGPALSPTGSGFQITGGLPGELELWERGVHDLTHTLAVD